MNKVSLLVKKAKEGMSGLSVKKKYIDSALDAIEVWLTDDEFKDYVPQLDYLIENSKWGLLLDSFYQVIPFGTGGRRGPVGIGPNRINPWTIQASAQGHSQFLINHYGNEAFDRGVVLAYDVRKYKQKGIYNDNIPNPIMNLSCEDLAVAALEVYTANGIKVYMFDGVRSTPQLSFTIRHLNAVAGAMFSASHNLPVDNGKKVYDENGGQLLPPVDQYLVDEVTDNVKNIKTITMSEAKEKKLAVYINSDVDDSYRDAVCQLSLSSSRGINIFYNPLHGTGLTSVSPILKQLGYKLLIDPKTTQFSPDFEGVTFHIPNPEVMESFESSLAYNKIADYDLILSTDPDADRLGLMVKHDSEWKFINGNEIGLILAQYGIEKYKNNGALKEDCVIIKTLVTTSLVEKICQNNNIRCISDLLVGFKYIGEALNDLDRKGNIDKFIVGMEESHGYIMGNYAREKDAAAAAVWISELAAEQKVIGKTLFDYLNKIYIENGYCRNYLTEIRLAGAKGMDQIALIMDTLRSHNVNSFGEIKVTDKVDRWDGEPITSETDRASRNMLVYQLQHVDYADNIRLIVRPSGTEAKIKIYVEVLGEPIPKSKLANEKNRIDGIRQEIERNVMKYCYKILNVEFPERGFLLFWQLPLDDKMKYFEIEDKIIELKDTASAASKKKELNDLLSFLGADPIKKVDDAFKAKYSMGILSYLGLNDEGTN